MRSTERVTTMQSCMREILEEETILKGDGLLSRATSLLRDASVAYPDDWLLNSKMLILKMLKSNGQQTNKKSAKAYNCPNPSNNPQSAAVMPHTAICYRQVEQKKTKCQQKLYQTQSLRTSESRLHNTIQMQIIQQVLSRQPFRKYSVKVKFNKRMSPLQNNQKTSKIILTFVTE